MIAMSFEPPAYVFRAVGDSSAVKTYIVRFGLRKFIIQGTHCAFVACCSNLSLIPVELLFCPDEPVCESRRVDKSSIRPEHVGFDPFGIDSSDGCSRSFIVCGNRIFADGCPSSLEGVVGYAMEWTCYAVIDRGLKV